MESTNSYQLKQQEDNYILSITMLEGSIKISCGNSSGQIYSQIFALSDLKTKEEIFQPVQNAFDVVEIFDYILKNEQFSHINFEAFFHVLILNVVKLPFYY